MDGTSLIREARRRAGITQGELAARVGTTQSAIARLERGGSAPSFKRVDRLIGACGLELRVRLVPRSERSHHAGAAHVPNEVLLILRALEDGGVSAIVVGDVAAMPYGFPTEHPILSIVPDPHLRNLEALASTLDDLHARVRIEGGSLPFERDVATLSSVERWQLATALGPLDIDHRPPGTDGFRDLVRDAVTKTVDGLDSRLASLADVVRILAASDAVDEDRLATMRRALASN